jgi:hypothetical protein
MLNLEPSLLLIQSYQNVLGNEKNRSESSQSFEGSFLAFFSLVSLSKIFRIFFPREFYQKIVFLFLNSLLFLEFFRQQLPEINLLQLIPGFYLIVFFGAILVLWIFSEVVFQLPFEWDGKKELGSKTKNRFQNFFFLKSIYQFFWINFVAIQTSIFPLSLDSFSSYGEQKLENLWSIDEVASLEFWFLGFFGGVSFLPSFFLTFFSTQENLQSLPFFWRNLTFFLFLFSGFFTPTLDAFTQVQFALTGLFFGIFLLLALQNRMRVTYLGITSLGT